MTFKDELSRTERSERVTTELEAKKLGFYLFHNVKTNFDRCAGGGRRVLSLCSPPASVAALRCACCPRSHYILCTTLFKPSAGSTLCWRTWRSF